VLDLMENVQFYSLLQGTVKRAQLLKILHCLNSGRMSKVKNKRLENIDVNDDIGETPV